LNHRSLVFIAIVGLTGAGAFSCASQSAATAAPDPSSAATAAPASQPQADGTQATEAPAAAPVQVAWKDLPKEQRGKFMASVVVPRMKEVFRAYDPKAFAEFGCKTCHGKSARDRGFEMPAPEIPVLPSTHEEFGALMKNKPEWVKFMAEKVTPEMATLLGAQPFNPKNPQPGAFGCSACHTSKGQ
jgi:hypothetical protein